MIRLISILIKLTQYWRWLGASIGMLVVVGLIVALKPTPQQPSDYRYMLSSLEQQLSTTEGLLSIRTFYLPNQGVVLYSIGQAELAEQFRDPTWVETQLRQSSTVLAGFPQNQALTWIYETPNAPIQQITLEVPLNYIDNSAYYVYSQQTIASSIATPVTPVDGLSPSPQPTQATPTVMSAITPTILATPIEGAITTTQPILDQTDRPWSLDPTQWNSLAGEWTYAPNYARQQNIDGYDYISFLQAQSLRDYRVEVRLRITDGAMGGGIVYHMPANTQRNGGQVVDLLHDDNFVRFGRYDELGNYQYQGGVQPEKPINDREWHNLALEQRGNQSTVIVDDQVIGTIQNQSNQGAVGLVTSQANVEFADFQIIPLNLNGEVSSIPTPTSADFVLPSGEFIPQPSTSLLMNFDSNEQLDWYELNGDWQVIDGEYHQLIESNLDLGSISPFYSGNYTATVQIRAVTGFLNGGFYFHMPNPDRKLNASVVTFTNDAQQLEWGYFDQNGNFNYNGVANLALDRQKEWHELKLRVIENQATVSVDGQIVAQSIPLSSTIGYVGLLSSGGHLAYDNLKFEAAP